MQKLLIPGTALVVGVLAAAGIIAAAVYLQGPPTMSESPQSPFSSNVSREASTPGSEPVVDEEAPEGLELATFGSGCFWCTEAVFQRLKGVYRVASGYSGGDVPNPTYEEVCSKHTGHAEVIQVSFDPQAISYDELLEVFWKTHDPTTLDRQGADFGPQYRSVIFYHNDEQRRLAEHYKQKLDEAGAF